MPTTLVSLLWFPRRRLYNKIMWIDSHCHLTYPGLVEHTAEVLARAHAAGVDRCLTIGTHPADHLPALSLAQRHAELFVALGVHPHYAAELPPAWLADLEAHLANAPKNLAIGECGLDYHYDFAPPAAQRNSFAPQLELARRRRLPVILHIREAHADGLAILQDFPDLPCVVHCFTGTPDECRAWLDRGAYIGITGIVTYKNAPHVREDARLVPADRLLVETDSPYLSPEPVRKIKINEPAHVAHVARFLASLRGVTESELAAQTSANAARLFGPQLLAP